MTDARLASLFPDTDRVVPFRRRRGARLGIAAAIVLALAGSVVVAVDATGSQTAHYRTATVGTHDVEALWEGVASVEAVSQAAVAFPIGGTVASVAVAVGDRVAVGQTLATIDSESLEQTLHERQAALATAELTLSKALAGESSSTGRPSAAVASAVTVPVTAASADNTAANTAARTDAQRTVLTAQQTVDTALAASASAYDAASTVCGAGTTTDATADAGPPPPTSTTTSTPSTTADPSGASGASASTCRDALTGVLNAQRTTADAQRALASASARLDELLATATGAASTSGAGASRTTTTTATTGPSAAELVADQKAVDAAGLDVIVATHAVAQAAITSPIAGTVVAVGIAPGDSVTAASATQAVTIVGTGGYEVTSSIPVDKITSIAVGQRATVVMDGTDAPLEGQVVSIPVAPDTTSTTSTSYRVVVGLDALSGDTSELHNGATGSIAIVTKATAAALAVPTSAVTTNGERRTTRVLSGTTVKETSVDVGVVGAVWTEITGGLRAGQRVVVADLDEALPGSATSSSAGSTATDGIPAGGPAGGLPVGFTPPNGPPPGG